VSIFGDKGTYMQTTKVIETIKWLESLIDSDTKEILFGDYLYSSKATEQDDLPKIIAATHELARVSSEINQNSSAQHILKSFGLGQLIDKQFITNLAVTASREQGVKKVVGVLRPIIESWKAMIGCAKPLELLTVPEEFRNKWTENSIISVELRTKGQHRPTLGELAKVTELLEQAYSLAAELYSRPQEKELDVIKLDGDNIIRVDCKGSEVLIKPLKEFINEAWAKVLSIGLDDLLQNNKELLGSLSIMEKIATLELERRLTPEKAEQLRRKLLGATLGLFARGAKIVDSKQNITDSKRAVQHAM